MMRWGLLILLFAGEPCRVPVFRYALERWRVGDYEAVLFHRGPLGAQDLAAFEKLQAAGANLVAHPVDLSTKVPASMLSLWNSQKEAAPPWLVVRHAGSERDDPPAWAGRWDRDAVRTLADSPARREIARRLLAGDSVVWALVEGDKPAENEAAAALVERELRALEKTLKLPGEETEDDGPEISTSIPLKLAFSMVRVRRRDPEERFLVELLLNLERESAASPEPRVIPIFGRGRALWPLRGRELGVDGLREAAEFLIGPCSCRVKELNPGQDLLFPIDWEKAVWGEGAPPAAEAPPLPLPVPIPQGAAPPAPASSSGPWLLLLLPAALVLGLFLRRKC